MSYVNQMIKSLNIFLLKHEARERVHLNLGKRHCAGDDSVAVRESVLARYDRTTLIRRRNDVMVGSPIKKSWRRLKICGFIKNYW